MMAATLVESSVTEGALDLSAKAPDTKATSPVPSVASDTESHHGGERSSSVSDDGHDTDGSTNAAVKPLWLAGGVSTALSPHSTTEIDSKAMFSPGAGDPTSQGATPGGNRPFKMYPFEPMQTAMYSQLAAAAASSAAAGLYQYPGAGMHMGLLDSSLTMSSPISQYLQQRKRRLDSRTAPQQSPRHPSQAPLSPSSSSSPSSPAMGPLSIPDPSPINIEPSSLSPQPLSKRTKTDHDDLSNMPPTPEDRRDEAYWERRRKNNEAAKRSRDARRAKEEEIALRAAFLEQENLKLRAQVAILKNETAKLHYMLYNRI